MKRQTCSRACLKNAFCEAHLTESIFQTRSRNNKKLQNKKQRNCRIYYDFTVLCFFHNIERPRCVLYAYTVSIPSMFFCFAYCCLTLCFTVMNSSCIQNYSAMSAYMKCQYPNTECQEPVTLLLCSQKSL